MTTLEMSPITAEKAETPELLELATHLAEDVKLGEVRLTDSQGHELRVPESVLRLLPSLVRELARGSAVAVVPIHAELTTQQAADFLQVSRPYFVKLLDSKEIPSTKVGTHRRVKFSDLLSYKQLRDSDRRRTLREMTAEAEEDGLPY